MELWISFWVSWMESLVHCRLLAPLAGRVLRRSPRTKKTVSELLMSGQENYGKSDAACVAEVKDLYRKLKLEVCPCPYHFPWSQPDSI